MTRTILYIPPENRPDVLAPSVGGGMVPVLIQSPTLREWVTEQGIVDESRGHVLRPRALGFPMALLLSLNGTPDAIGMGRARDVLADLDTPGATGIRFARSPDSENQPSAWAMKTEQGMVAYDAIGGRGSWGHYTVTYREIPALRAPPADLDLECLRAWALATILAARIGGSVVVVDG